MAIKIPFIRPRPEITIKPEKKEERDILGRLPSEVPTISAAKPGIKIEPFGPPIKRFIELKEREVREARAVRIPFAREKTFQAPGDVFITKVVSRLPEELLGGIQTRAVNWVRKNINTIRAGKPVETEQFKSILGIDPRRFGISDEALVDTGTLFLKQFEEEEKRNPSKGRDVNLVRNTTMAVAKTIVPEVFDVLFAKDITKFGIRAGVEATRATVRQLPDSLLFKITEKKISPVAIRDVLIGTKQSSAKEFAIADKFIKGLTAKERQALFSLTRGYERLGLSVPLKTGVEPTVLGKFARAVPPTVKLPPQISGLLPSGKPAGFAARAGFLDIEALGNEFIGLAKKARDSRTLEVFKKALTSEEAKLLVARGITEQVLFESAKQVPTISPELQPLAQEARKYKSAEEFVGANKIQPILKNKYPNLALSLSESGGEITLHKVVVPIGERGRGIGTQFMNDLIQYADRTGQRIVLTPTKDFGATSVTRLKDFYKEFGFIENKGRTRDFSTRESMIRGETKDFKSQLTDFYNRVKGEVKAQAKQPTVREGVEPQEIQKASFLQDNIKETSVNKEAEQAAIKKDTTDTVQDVAKPPKEPTEDLITTRKFKQTDEWKDFAKYAEENLQDKDISPAVLFRHVTMTMERVAEYLDGGIGGRTYREIVKPVYDSAEKMQLEGRTIKEEFDSFRILEGSIIDRDASLFAQKKLDDVSQRGKDVAKYTRDKYDEFLERLNIVRSKIGVEPIPKRQDYITHLNELNVLSELFGGMERISVKRHISNLKSELLDTHPDWTDARAFDAAKRKVEGLTGVAQYVDARQPIFKFAKKRLGEYEANPSIVRSFNAYSQNALRYIYQAENVARNKAFKDVLPANAREFTRLWNTEQVAGRQAPSFLSPVARRALSAIRGTLGANTILGNLATTMMQTTSWAQVVALAGVKNTFYGLGSRLRTYIPGLTNQFDVSRTRHLRNLNIDIGLGDSLIDKALVNIGKYEALRNPAARTRQAVDVGRDFLMAIMETADQFTVGATYQAFYRKGVLDGLDPQKAMEFAEIMTGKTQANYFKEALPPFLNTIEGKTLGQFGTYGMNQWEMFKRDFGKVFKLDEKNPKSVKNFFKQFMVFLLAAYIIDFISEKTFGRQPYDVKELVDDTVGFARGEITGSQLFDTSKDTVATYIPFMGSVKFDSMPPVIEFGSDVIGATLGTGKTQEDAIANLEEKWIYNILLPYGGNQLRKSLQGTEASTDVDLPFVRNTSKNIDIETNIDKAKSILFGPYASQEAINYFENRERREAIKDKFGITGTITSDENIAKLKKMSKDEFEIYVQGYAESTLKTIKRRMGTSISIPSIKIPSVQAPRIKIPSIKISQ